MPLFVFFWIKTEISQSFFFEAITEENIQDDDVSTIGKTNLKNNYGFLGYLVNDKRNKLKQYMVIYNNRNI